MISLARSIQRFHGQKFLINLAYKQQLKELGICATMDWLNYSAGQLVSDSPTTRCRRVAAEDGTVYYFKRYYYSTKNSLLFWMRPGKATVEVWAYRQLIGLEIPTLEVVAFSERRVLGLLKSAFIVTRAISDSMDLEYFALNIWYQMPDPMRRQVYDEISNQLVDQVRKAHRGRFFHHDLKWRNILVRKEGAHYSTVWIDAPRASNMLFRGRRGVVVDLAGLARIAISLLSHYDRMRFVCKYLGSKRKPGDAKQLYQEVASNLSRRLPSAVVLPPRKQG
ncbi:hypothetical protein MNBD_GAMMA26-1590 [hydrothermal vent metagenome]|uniref:Protein kinase domain-containing protein n=1 Tax=hydrothermal vent metagenome TaxID=652676 RepID=A0A3B1B5E9_9ZZZZ